jgi:hypothetical protein
MKHRFALYNRLSSLLYDDTSSLFVQAAQERGMPLLRARVQEVRNAWKRDEDGRKRTMICSYVLLVMPRRT